MTPKELLIERLRQLCGPGDGYIKIADEADVSAENIKQILSGVLLPSKQPRGVGPNLQRKLEAAFPGWADAPEGSGSQRLSRMALDLAEALDKIKDPRAQAEAYLAALERLGVSVGQAQEPTPSRKQRTADAA